MSETSTKPQAFDPVPFISQELNLPPRGVAAVVKLLEENATVPFIARYRKEVTGGLDEVQIRDIQEKRAYILELEERRASILEEIGKQGKLTDDLKKKILACTTKAALEDLYLPYKPKRRTRATIAREKGLEPLALRILAQSADGDPRVEAQAFVSAEKEVADVAAALAGARDIVAEIVAEHADVRALTREAFEKEGILVSEGVPDKIKEPTKFEQYYEWREPIAEIPSHRFLAIRRGEREGILRASIEVDGERVVPRLENVMKVDRGSPWCGEMSAAIADAFKRLLAPSVENDVRVDLKLKSDRSAVDVFADNLRNLLLSAPLGTKSVIGIDPGLRTGCKVAVVDSTGKFLVNDTIYPSQGAAREEDAKRVLLTLVKRHTPFAIAIGNGTAGRETESFVKKTLKEAGITDVVVVPVSESGASVYSASDVAREEFPELDLTVRGAISIARRLQDPLAELVKVDPKSIGVGQYQHDVHQPLLARKLGEVVESCVNHVGVELNTASASLLAYVAGIGGSLAKKIVKHREEKGAFTSRQQVLEVSGLGPRAFEQCAGFLRVHGAANPLDSSAVHPERYALVERIAKDMGVSLAELVGNTDLAKKIDIQKYVGEGVGEPTLRDIVAELGKPGRDPRASFEPPKFRDDVMEITDLKEGMILEGVVTNVTAFGAFVDLGVHQDGLVHVSKLSDRFIKDPSEVVKVGDKLTVKVLEVDLARKRISLSARMHDEASKGPRQGNQHGGARAPGGPQRGGPQRGGGGPQQKGPPPKQFANNPFAKLLDRK
ncbi:Tex family protein [Sandaracinus amylolyticus]|uniref:Transcription accessory protein n=1 Tax=Sandaracinus amylolyticus TaxID=927083 RepID=A0A0F6YMS5_9BACT|nr:Tex family protein [Sandaracinus amylolyticus]AKF11366.1 Transcription accessory protein [Sandaracinus amylolyticus]